MTKESSNELDSRLASPLVKPPDDFAESVINYISHQQYPADTRTPAKPGSIGFIWPSAALTTGAAIGVFQVISFIFGVWIPVTAG